MPLNFLAVTRFGFSMAHWCFSPRWATFDIPDQTPVHNDQALLLLDVLSADPRPRVSVWNLFIQFCELRETGPTFRWAPVTMNVPMIFFIRFSRKLIQGCVRSPCHVNISQWYSEWFIFRHMEFNCQFNVMTINAIPCDRPTNGRASLSSAILSNGWNPSDSPWRSSLCPSPRAGWSRVRWNFGKLDLVWTSWVFHLRLEIWKVHHFSAWGLRLHWVSEHEFLTRRNFPAPQYLRPKYLFPNSRRHHLISEEYSRQNFLTEPVESWLGCARNRMTFYHRTKRNYRSLEWFLISPFIWCFPVWQEVLNVSQISVTCHGISPLFFVWAWLQQYCKSTYLNSAYRLLTNAIRLGTVKRRCTMIPG